MSAPVLRSPDNVIDAWVPQYWANESVAILEENMVVGNLVHRDFEAILAEAGEVVNTRKPGEFTMIRKAVGDQITLQAATATNIQVTLNQHMHVSFLIKDREQSKSFRDLVTEYLSPALLAIARGIDKVLLSQAPRFIRSDIKTAGSLGADEGVASMLQTRENLNRNKADVADRSMILSPKSETKLLSLDIFLFAEHLGDGGTAVREASLGRRLGFNCYMCQNVCSVTGTSDIVTGAVNNAGGGAVAAQALTVDGLSAAIAVGTWFTVAGDMIPQRITGTTGGATPTALAFLPGLKTAVLDNAVVTLYDPMTVNQSSTAQVDSGLVGSSGYIANWEKAIIYDGNTATLQIGQWVQFAANGDLYVVIDTPSSTSVLLDRPLVSAIADNAVIFVGPNGTFNFAFKRNAIALVTRPMALPRAGTGAVGATANYKGLSVRIVWAYDPYAQGMIVTADILCGVAILDKNLGEVMLG